MNNYKICYVKDFRESKNKKIRRIKRCGIILIVNDGTDINKVCLGIHKESEDYTDFGGIRKDNENVIDACYREFTEETLELFSNYIDFEKRNESYIYYDKSNAIIFLYINCVNIVNIKNEFKKKLITIENYEISSIEFIDVKTFIEMIRDEHNKKIYKKIKKCLMSIKDLKFLEFVKK